MTPDVNQVQYHIGMGGDPIGVKRVCEKHGALGNGSAELITGGLVTSIGINHNKTDARVALQWRVFDHQKPWKSFR